MDIQQYANESLCSIFSRFPRLYFFLYYKHVHARSHDNLTPVWKPNNIHIHRPSLLSVLMSVCPLHHTHSSLFKTGGYGARRRFSISVSLFSLSLASFSAVFRSLLPHAAFVVAAAAVAERIHACVYTYHTHSSIHPPARSHTRFFFKRGGEKNDTKCSNKQTRSSFTLFCLCSHITSHHS